MKRGRNETSRPKPAQKKTARPLRSKKANLQERRVSTPRPDLVVIKIGRPKAEPAVADIEKASTLVANLIKATRKPGTSREKVFNSSLGKQVFAYSVDPKDTTKIIREDVSGKTSVGRFLNGRFQALPTRTP
jgi:hypothetical protein